MFTGGKGMEKFLVVVTHGSANTARMRCAIIACPWSRMINNTTKNTESSTYPTTPIYGSWLQRSQHRLLRLLLYRLWILCPTR